MHVFSAELKMLLPTLPHTTRDGTRTDTALDVCVVVDPFVAHCAGTWCGVRGSVVLSFVKTPVPALLVFGFCVYVSCSIVT